MRRTVLILLVVASIAFVASSAGFALVPNGAYERLLYWMPYTGVSNSATPAMARPAGGALRLLLLGVWLAVGLHALRAVMAERRIGRLIARRKGRPLPRPYMVLGHPPFIVALAAGAIWPWTAANNGPLVPLLFAAVMMACSLWAAIDRRYRQRHNPVFSGTVEVFAGWATVALYSSFASMLIAQLNISVPLAAVVSVLLLMVTVVEVQLRLKSAVAYSFTIIWALIGIAGNAVQSDLTVATAAIAAIAAIAAVLVRVMS